MEDEEFQIVDISAQYAGGRVGTDELDNDANELIKVPSMETLQAKVEGELRKLRRERLKNQKEFEEVANLKKELRSQIKTCNELTKRQKEDGKRLREQMEKYEAVSCALLSAIKLR